MATHIQIQGDSQWQTYKSIHESNEIMLSQQLATDVTFNLPVVKGGGETKSIGAHKYMLISRSPVFWSMFCEDVKETDKVDIKDIQFDVFKEMLNYVYTEKVNITGDNVLSVLHASKKYIMGSLTEKCTEFLETNLNTSNVCTFLERCQLFNESELVTKCLEIIQYDTDLVMKSDGFMQISKNTLNQILDAEKLSIPEVQVLEACLSWAGHQNQGSSNPDVIRKTLGETLYKIRIPTMSTEELGSVVSPSSLLTEKEELLCYRFASNSKLPFDLPFPREPRTVTNKNIALSRDMSSEGNINLQIRSEFNGQLKNSSACSLEVIGFQVIYTKPFAVNVTIKQLERPQNTGHVFTIPGSIFGPSYKTLVNTTNCNFDDMKQIGGCTVSEVKLDNSFVLDSQDTVTYKVVFTTPESLAKSICFVNGQSCVFRSKEKTINANHHIDLTQNLLQSGTTLQNLIPFSGITCKCIRGK